MNPASSLACWIPGLQVWYGIYTKSWWAFIPGHPDLLVEAPSPEVLVQKLTLFTGVLTTPGPKPFR